MDAAWEKIVLCFQFRTGNPCGYRRACRLRNLELYRPAGFLLKDEGAGRHALAVADVAYPQLHEIACTELAIDSKIEEGEISTSTGNLKPYANRPYLFEFEWRLLAYELPLVSRLASDDCSAGLHDRLLLVGSLQFAGRLNHDEPSEPFLAATVADRPAPVNGCAQSIGLLADGRSLV